MRLLDYLTGLISLLALPFILWWGVNQSPHSAAALEKRLETRAQLALQQAGIDWANVEMDGQTAILSGAAPSEDAVEDAARTVLRSSGKGGLLFGGVAQVETRVHPADAVRPYSWSVEKMPTGGLALSGHVPSKAVRTALVAEAETVSGGAVEDRMLMATGVPPGNWQGIAQLAIRQVAELDAGDAKLVDHVLTVRGNVGDDALRARLTATTTAVAGPFRGVALIRGQPLWSATRTGDALVLSGSVPGESERRALLSTARRDFSGEVRDEMVTADTPAEGWIDGAKAGLGHLADFSDGVMTFDPAVNGFTFEGTAPASTLQFLHEDMVRAAGRWRFVLAANAEPAAPSAPEWATPAGCADAINEMLASPAISFVPGRAEFSRDSAKGLDALARMAGECAPNGAFDIDVEGDALAEARAAALAGFIERAGMARPRIAAIGYGSLAAVEGMDIRAAGPSDRRPEFTVRERSAQ